MAKKKSTQEIIESWPDYKKAGFEACWAFKWRTGSNKRAAAEAWDNWITTQALCSRVVHGAREYTARSHGNQFIRGMSPWVNAESWNDELPSLPKEQVTPVSEYCECGEIATQRQESLCADCWTKKYGVIRINGKTYPAYDVLRSTIKEIGMEPRDGETRDEWTGRLRSYVFKQKGKVGMAKERRHG